MPKNAPKKDILAAPDLNQILKMSNAPNRLFTPAKPPAAPTPSFDLSTMMKQKPRSPLSYPVDRPPSSTAKRTPPNKPVSPPPSTVRPTRFEPQENKNIADIRRGARILGDSALKLPGKLMEGTYNLSKSVEASTADAILPGVMGLLHIPQPRHTPAQLQHFHDIARQADDVTHSLPYNAIGGRDGIIMNGGRAVRDHKLGGFVRSVPNGVKRSFVADPAMWTLNTATALTGFGGLLGGAGRVVGAGGRMAAVGAADAALTGNAARSTLLTNVARGAGRIERGASKGAGVLYNISGVTPARKLGVAIGGKVGQGVRHVGGVIDKKLEERYPSDGDLTHWTNKDAAANILATRKLSASKGAYGMTAGRSSKHPIIRSLQTQSHSGITEPIEITGPAAKHFTAPPVIGPWSLARRAFGHREGPFGTINLDTGELTDELFDKKFNNGDFRRTNPQDLTAYNRHKWQLDKLPDHAIYGLGLGGAAGGLLWNQYSDWKKAITEQTTSQPAPGFTQLRHKSLSSKSSAGIHRPRTK